MWDSLLTDYETALGNIGNMFLYDPKAPMLFQAVFLDTVPFIPARLRSVEKSRTKMIIFVVAFSLYFYYKSSGLFFLMLIATSFCGLEHLQNDGPRAEPCGEIIIDVVLHPPLAIDSRILQVRQFLPMELEYDGAGQFPAA